MAATFRKGERLCSREATGRIFARKSTDTHLHYPLVGVWFCEQASGAPYPAQALFSVGKKKFRRAHDRNRLKRQIREAYRLHKDTLLYPSLREAGKQVSLAFMYIGKEPQPYDRIEEAVSRILRRIAKSCAQSAGMAAGADGQDLPKGD